MRYWKCVCENAWIGKEEASYFKAETREMAEMLGEDYLDDFVFDYPPDAFDNECDTEDYYDNLIYTLTEISEEEFENRY